MAGAGKRTFTAGEVLTAASVNDYLMDQTVMNFAGTAARSSAIPTPSEGMVSYRQDAKNIEFYNGTSWVASRSASGTYTANAIAGTAFGTYISITLTTSVRPILVSFSVTGNNSNSGGIRTMTLRAQIDGVTVGNEITGISLPFVSGVGTRFTSAHSFIVTPTAGSKTITLQISVDQGASVQIPFAQLVVYEI